ncbi:hypothetical protein V6N11_044137 [Hibiscus sabdariffa]|uniref:Pentatricopeptide repeat-containing protein n=1 Tax=Hibiscus sabdariffa TaxID=183260 RepID=A0ABR2REI6_9ROSI
MVMISGYVVNGRFDEAGELYYWMPNKNVVAMTAMITGIGEEALKLYSEMVKLDIRPDIFTLISVFTACSDLASVKEGRLMHVFVMKYGFELDLSLCHSLITMYNKLGSILDAEQAFRQMNKAWLISRNTIISAFAQHCLYEKAADFFNRMEVC